MMWFYLGTGNLFRAYGATSALILIGFLLINYLVKEKAVASLEEEKATEAEKKPTLTTGGTFDESAFMSPAGTPFIPASRTPAAVAATRSSPSNACNEKGRGKSHVMTISSDGRDAGPIRVDFVDQRLTYRPFK